MNTQGWEASTQAMHTNVTLGNQTKERFSPQQRQRKGKKAKLDEFAGLC
jgi:hypothetical protein